VSAMYQTGITIKNQALRWET